RIEIIKAGEKVTVDGLEHTARLLADATLDGVRRLAVEVDGVVSTFDAARDGDTLWLGSGGASWRLELVSRERALRESLARIERELHPASPEVRSPMPGTVVSVVATTGDTVAVGDTIATIEAMKMEHRLTAPVAGVVTVTVTTGGLVKLDQVVATIDPATVDTHPEPTSTDTSSTDTTKEP